MSTNSKNIIRPEYLKNFTTYIERRIIITSKTNVDLRWVDTAMMQKVNQKLNYILQNINLKTPDRQIPYMTLIVRRGDEMDTQSRIIVRNFETSPVFEKDIKLQMDSSTCLTHLIDILVASGYRTLRQSDITGAGMTVDQKDIESAIIDVALDIAMFNSYSFLRDMDLDEKRMASKMKYDFYRNQSDMSFYECEDNDLDYFSLAFLARKSTEEFDVDGYIDYWNNFVTYYYPSHVHIELSPKEQIKQHIDIKELPNNVHKRFYR